MKFGYVHIDQFVFSTKLAISDEEQRKGLMFETSPEVMTFIYDTPRINKFWMKNTPLPLDIIFVNKNKVSQIHYGKPYCLDKIGNDDYSDLVIELPKGYVKEFKIKLGDEAGIVNLKDD